MPRLPPLLLPLVGLFACAPPPEIQVQDTAPEEVEARVNILYPEDGQQLPLFPDGAARFAVFFEIEGLDFEPEKAGDDPNGDEGHVHLYIGDEATYPSSTAVDVTVSGEPDERIDILLVWAANNHVEDNLIADAIHVTLAEVEDLSDDTGDSGDQ